MNTSGLPGAAPVSRCGRSSSGHSSVTPVPAIPSGRYGSRGGQPAELGPSRGLHGQRDRVDADLEPGQPEVGDRGRVADLLCLARAPARRPGPATARRRRRWSACRCRSAAARRGCRGPCRGAAATVSGPVLLALVFRNSAVTCTVESGRTSCGSRLCSVTVTGPAGRRARGRGERQAGRQRHRGERARCRDPADPIRHGRAAPAARATRVRSSSYASGPGQLGQRHPGDLGDLDVGVGQLAAHRLASGSGARSCASAGPRR